MVFFSQAKRMPEETIFEGNTYCANAFADYFSLFYCYSCRGSQFRSSSINECDISNIIKKLKPKGSVSSDGIRSYIVKSCATKNLVKPLSHIFNLVLDIPNFLTRLKKLS